MGEESETPADQAVVEGVREPKAEVAPEAKTADSQRDPVSRRASDIDELVSTVDSIRTQQGVFETFMANVKRWAKGAGRNV